MNFLLLFGTGIVTGVMNAVAGGGGLLTFPVLMWAGLPALAANATNNIAILPGQISSAYGYRNYLSQIPRKYLLLIIPCTVGGIIGALILRNTTTENFQQMVPGLLGLAVVLFIFQPFMHKLFHTFLHGSKSQIRSWHPLFIFALIMMPLSIYGGYFGVGFGLVMLAFLGFTEMTEIHEMNAFKNLVTICISVVTIVCLFSAQIISWHNGLIMAAGNLIGGYSGARLAQRIPSHWVRIVVIVIGVCTAGYLALRTY